MGVTARKITSVLLSLSMAAAVLSAFPAVSAAAGTKTVELSFAGTTDFYGKRDILQQYVCKSGTTVKLLNEKKLYSYNVADDTFTLEYTFPDQTDINTAAGQSGTVRVFGGVSSAYVNESTGKLYYAYDKYKKFNKPEGMAVEVITYDLEQGKVTSTSVFAGQNLSAVGADNSGNIYLATRAQFSDMGNETALLVYNASGKTRLAKSSVANPIDTFCGFTNDGKFYFSEVKYTLNENGRYYVERYLKAGSRGGGTLSFADGIVCNLNYYYNQPAKIVSDRYLANYTTRLYDMTTDEAVMAFDGTPASESDFTARHNGAGVVVDGGFAYVLHSAGRINCYSLDGGVIASSYESGQDIFNFVKCGDSLLALIKDGAAYHYQTIPLSTFAPAEATTLNLNDLPVYQHTKAEIVQKFAEAAPKDFSAQFYETRGSADAPYREFTLTGETKQNILNLANYYRWREGLSTFASADETTWSNAAKGAVLTDKNVRVNHALSHYPPRPDDMDEDFYAAAYQATSTSNIAYGFASGQTAIVHLFRGFLNDKGYTIPGHRDTFFTRNGDRFAAGYTDYGAVNTIQYTGTPNPQGNSVVGNNQPAYAWPTPGYFPVEDIDVSSVWSINLNTDLAGLSSKAFTVTVTDLDTGEEFVRDSYDAGLYTTTSWGRYISFAPPVAESYSGKSYKVEVFNLSDSDGMPLTLEYTVNFFSYADKVEIDGAEYTCDAYGRLTEVLPPYLPGDVNLDNAVNVRDVTETQRALAQLITLTRAQELAADVNRDGKVSVDDITFLQQYLAEYIAELT